MSGSLATGAKLDGETWADFVSRLRHDCEGEGVQEHATANAIFTVEARRIVSGIETDYTDQLLVYCDDSSWYSPQEYWDAADANQQEVLNAAAQNAYARYFLELGDTEQWDVLSDLPNHTVTGWQDRWEHVGTHFTKDAAEAFIGRKKHDYPDGIRVYVESQYYAWEFNAIKEAILAGRLVYSEAVATITLTPADRALADDIASVRKPLEMKHD